MKPIPTLTDEQKAFIKGKKISESIRYLDSEGYSRADIARIIDRRYQHVRNVLNRAEAKKKTTVTLDAALYEEMNNLAKKIGVKRDSFLNALLDDALSVIENLPPNTAESKELLRAFYRRDSSTQVEKGELVRVNLNLSEDLVNRTNETCRSKNVPRDLFFDAVIEAAAATLGHVEAMMDDPIHFYESLGNKFTASFHLSESDALDLRQLMDNQAYIVQAIANIKGVSIGAVIKSLDGLTPDAIRRLLANDDIRREIKRVSSEDDTQIELDDLMDEAKWT